MRIILKSCTIVSEDRNQKGKQDILIEDGIITKIAEQIEEDADHIVSRQNLHVSAGWFDAKVNFCDPGNEIKEDINSGLKAAEAGGMTAVGISPNTSPRTSNKSQIEYIKMKGAFSPVAVYPYATLTANMEGENLSEMFDLKAAGAIGFTDVHQTIQGGILYRALLYAKNFDGKVISFPYDNSIFGNGFIHEGKVSVSTGLKAIPSLAESMTIERDLNLVRYTEGSIHFTGISTKEGVELIRKAKAEGISVTADVHVHNLVFTEEDLTAFDSLYKVLPPLRAKKDQEALIAGLKDGTIDFVCSDHTPEDVENKEVEFDHAAFGMIGVQTLFPLLNSVKDLDLVTKAALISTKPRKIFDLPNNAIVEGNFANLTLFDPESELDWNADMLHSKSKNSPLIGKKLKGVVYGIISDGILSIDD